MSRAAALDRLHEPVILHDALLPPEQIKGDGVLAHGPLQERHQVLDGGHDRSGRQLNLREPQEPAEVPLGPGHPGAVGICNREVVGIPDDREDRWRLRIHVLVDRKDASAPVHVLLRHDGGKGDPDSRKVDLSRHRAGAGDKGIVSRAHDQQRGGDPRHHRRWPRLNPIPWRDWYHSSDHVAKRRCRVDGGAPAHGVPSDANQAAVHVFPLTQVGHVPLKLLRVCRRIDSLSSHESRRIAVAILVCCKNNIAPRCDYG
mmetsp:Transcript_1135/g.2048  ORF Transcript_1135/g.2048 Transcript_1135/m.2048 type:complete len:258 (+) Transcript_1135:143-916(+)